MNSINEQISTSIETLLEMFKDRNLKITKNAESIKEIINKLNNKSNFSLDFNEEIKVVYYLSSKFKLPEIKFYFEEAPMFEKYILITDDKLTKTNINAINNLRNNDEKINIQIFNIKELMFNISKHSLVPKHILVTDTEEIDTIFKNYNLKTKFQLPFILKSDPMAKYLDLKHGDIIKIIRNSPTAGEYISYRVCFKNN